jgi:hypothetical protein
MRTTWQRTAGVHTSALPHHTGVPNSKSHLGGMQLSLEWSAIMLHKTRAQQSLGSTSSGHPPSWWPAALPSTMPQKASCRGTLTDKQRRAPERELSATSLKRDLLLGGGAAVVVRRWSAWHRWRVCRRGRGDFFGGSGAVGAASAIVHLWLLMWQRGKPLLMPGRSRVHGVRLRCVPVIHLLQCASPVRAACMSSWCASLSIASIQARTHEGLKCREEEDARG